MSTKEFEELWIHFGGGLVAARLPQPSQVALQKAVVEKVGLKFLHAVYIAKSSETMFSELAVGFENFRLEGRNETRAARARSPAACRGGGGP